jgi:hypothetical protein
MNAEGRNPKDEGMTNDETQITDSATFVIRHSGFVIVPYAAPVLLTT